LTGKGTSKCGLLEYALPVPYNYSVINKNGRYLLYGILTAALLRMTFPCFGEEKHIFFIHSNSSSLALPWMKSICLGVEEAMNQRPDWVLHSEYMDWSVAQDNLSGTEWRDYLMKKYRGVPFAAVLSESSVASAVINRYGEEMFPGAPKIMYSVEDLESKPQSFYLKSSQNQSIRETFGLAARLSPDSREIVIINNLKEYFAGGETLIEDLAEERDMTVRVLEDFSKEELLAEMDGLTGKEIVFYFLVYSDNRGEKFVPGKILKDVCSRSDAPVYSFWSSLMGTGLAGGVMLDGGKISTEMFRAAEDFITAGRFSDDYATNSTFLDWAALKRFKLKAKDAGEGVILINEPPPLFSVYYKQILGLGIFVLILFLSLALYSRSRIKKTHGQLEKLYWNQERHARMGEMMNFVAHQWQQYLYTISLYMDGMERKEKKRNLPDHSLEPISAVRTTLSHMYATLNNFRNFITPDNKRENFPASELCESVLSLLDDQLSSRGITMNYTQEGDSRIWGIRNEFEQVLINLLGNSSQILKERSVEAPVITLIVEESETGIRITVEDNGGGIPEEIRHKIFSLYQTSREKGSGMGLYMSRRIIRERFNGTLELEEGAAGARFVIGIPREARKERR
jgi:signal transduction histidine kinase